MPRNNITFPAGQLAAMDGVLNAVLAGRPVDPRQLRDAEPVVNAIQAFVDHPDAHRGTTVLTPRDDR